MKVNIDSEVDTLYITFNDNKIILSIEIYADTIVDVDAKHQLIGLELLHYNRSKKWGSSLLKDSDLPILNENDILFSMDQGYMMAYFDINSIKDNDAPCKYYMEGDSSVLEDMTVKQYIQEEVDYFFAVIDKFKK